MVKKALIISYYWPPSAGVGVQRWLKFAKYLPQFGWEPTIITPQNPQFNVSDATLAASVAHVKVHALPIWEPFDLFQKMMGKKGQGQIKQGLVLEGGKKSLASNAMIWARGNLFLPDPRIFWKKNVLEFLETHLKTNHYDVLITTGPPHSMHLIGLAASQRFKIKWVADFRDPWSKWDMLPELKVGALAQKWHNRAERKVLKHADVVLCTSNNQAAMFRQLGAKNISVITNGFDADDLPKNINHQPTEKIELLHLGLLNAMRNPETLWQALQNLLIQHPDFAQKFALTLGGIVGDAVKNSIAKYPELAACVTNLDYVPHQEMLARCAAANVLLIVQNQSASAPLIIPAKLFEYLAVGRPILQIGPTHCHAAEILEETQAGITVAHSDVAGIAQALQSLFITKENFLPNKAIVAAYSRSALTQKLADLLKDLAEKD